MADYISREAAIKQFCDDCMDREWCKSNGESCSRINNINAVPAADVVEKKEWDKLMFLVEAANQILEAAKWISVKERLPETDGNCGVAEHSPNRNYCHNCGCAMGNEK